jgi:transcriptional regulator with XRE-family HTH domain
MQRRGRQIQPTDLKRKAIGSVVAELRRQAGFSQERLGAECGFERTYLSRVERGILNPTAIRIWTIADALNTPLHEIATRMEQWVRDHAKPGEIGRRLTLGTSLS